MIRARRITPRGHLAATLALCLLPAPLAALEIRVERPVPGAVASLPAGHVSGPAWVADGDTLEIQGVTIELAGIDAPELGQTCFTGNIAYSCGDSAAWFLADFAEGRSIDCAIETTDAEGRKAATCRAGGRDLSEMMVSAGQAIARPAGRYQPVEAAARANGIGIWATDFVDPADYLHWKEVETLRAGRPPASPYQ